jgi:hypothetical protein
MGKMKSNFNRAAEEADKWAGEAYEKQKEIDGLRDTVEKLETQNDGLSGSLAYIARILDGGLGDAEKLARIRRVIENS